MFEDWFAHFPKDNFLFLTLNEYKEDRGLVLQKIFKFVCRCVLSDHWNWTCKYRDGSVYCQCGRENNLAHKYRHRFKKHVCANFCPKQPFQPWVAARDMKFRHCDLVAGCLIFLNPLFQLLQERISILTSGPSLLRMAALSTWPGWGPCWTRHASSYRHFTDLTTSAWHAFLVIPSICGDTDTWLLWCGLTQ